MASADSALPELVADHLVLALARQGRLMRVLEGELDWSMDADAGTARVGDLDVRIDVVGTSSALSGTFTWGWASPAFREEQVLSAGLLWQLGMQHGIDELTDARELPATVVDVHTAGVIGSGEAGADAYYAGFHDEGAVVLLLRHPRLADAPLTMHDVAPVLDQLAAGALGVDAARALGAFAQTAPPGFTVEEERKGFVVRGPGGAARVELDRRGHVKAVDADLHAIAPAAPEPVREDEVLALVGPLAAGDGRVIVCDPFVSVEGATGSPLPGALFTGTHHVGFHTLGEDRIELAYLLLDADAEPVTWQPVGTALVDSGAICFASAAGAARLAAGDEALLAALARDLDATGTHAVADGVVALATAEDGPVAVLYGFDDRQRLVRVALDLLEDDPPPDGLQRALLVGAALGGEPVPENTVLLPPRANRALAALERQVVAAIAGGDGHVDVDVQPEYAGDSPVPVRIAFTASGEDLAIGEVLDVSPFR